MFKGLRVLLAPRINDAVEKFRIKIWREQGADIRDKRYLSAQMKRKRRSVEKNHDLYILANDLAQPEQLKQEIKKIENCNLLKFPIVRSDWLTKSLEAEKLLPYADFIYRPKRVTSDSEIPDAKKRKISPKVKMTKPDKATTIISLLQRNKNRKEESAIDSKPLKTNNMIIDKFEKIINLLEIDKFVNLLMNLELHNTGMQ